MDADGKKMKEERNIGEKKSDLVLSRFDETMMMDAKLNDRMNFQVCINNNNNQYFQYKINHSLMNLLHFHSTNELSSKRNKSLLLLRTNIGDPQTVNQLIHNLNRFSAGMESTKYIPSE